MNLDLKPLKCFIAVAEELSFSVAAKRVHLTQPSISAQIRELERYLGIELFLRSTRSVVLTRLGRELYPVAKKVVNELDEFRSLSNRLNRQDARRLHIGAAYYTFNIPERVAILEAFAEQHPEITLDVYVQWQRTLLEFLSAGKIDLVLMVGYPVSASEFEDHSRNKASELLYPDNLSVAVLKRKPIQLLVPVESGLSDFEIIPLSALQGLRIAIPSREHGIPLISPVIQVLESANAEIFVPPEPHAAAVDRYGAKHRIPAVSFGWFQEMGGVDDNMVLKPVEGIDAETELVFVSEPDTVFPNVETFANFVKDAMAFPGR